MIYLHSSEIIPNFAASNSRTPAQEDKVGEETMKAYHGTDNEFDRFDSSFFGQNTDGNASDETMAQTARLGFWFTSNPDFAATVYDKVMECELSIENPLEVDTLDTLTFWMESQEKSGEEIREMLMEQGYDGIIVENDEEFEGTSYVAFDPHQINILK